MKQLKKIIKELCTELDINITELSEGWVLALEKNCITKYISGYKFDLNSEASSIIIDDKYATYEVLSNNNIDVLKHFIIFDKDNEKIIKESSYDKSIRLLNEYKSIVIKSNIGTCGNYCYKIESKKDLDYALNHVFDKTISASVCPFYNIKKEYRTIMLDGKPLLIYAKNRPIVMGDGKSTIKELLINFNKHYFSNKKINNESKILKENETYEYGWQFNLSKGSIPTLIDKDLTKKISILAIETANILNLKFGAVDIVEIDNEYKVLEVNSGVMLENLIIELENGYEIAKEIYKNALIQMFNIK